MARLCPSKPQVSVHPTYIFQWKVLTKQISNTAHSKSPHSVKWSLCVSTMFYRECRSAWRYFWDVRTRPHVVSYMDEWLCLAESHQDNIFCSEHIDSLLTDQKVKGGSPAQSHMEAACWSHVYFLAGEQLSSASRSCWRLGCHFLGPTQSATVRTCWSRS